MTLEHKQLDAAAHVQLDARDVARQVGAEERDRVGDVLRVAGRFSTVRLTICSFIAAFAIWNASVPITPGTIALHVMPCRPPSIASVRVSPRMPAFVVE